MAHKLFSLVVMLVLALPVVIFAFAEDEPKAPMPAEVMQKQIADAIKVYGEKKEVYRKDVLDLFERKEKFARDKGDLKTINLIKKEKDAFFENGKDPTLFFVTDQKRFLELAKLDLIKAYEKTIKDCLKMKLDVEAEGFSKELEKIRAGKIKDEEMKAKPIFLEAPFSADLAKTAQMELAKSLGKLMDAKIDLGRGVKLEMVLIPSGKFMMGDPGKDHEVRLTKPFYMGKYEVTQEQWQAVMGSNPSDTRSARLPVNNVSWNDCQQFIKKLNAKTKGGYRLPTEAEWEYACRAGTTTTYSWGGVITPKDANYGDSKIGKPVPVGSYNPNGFGLDDMHGNIWEWCEDWYGEYPEGSVTDPKGPAQGPGRVLRGGPYVGGSASVRSAERASNSPNFGNLHRGFRLAKTMVSEVAIASTVPESKTIEVKPTKGILLNLPFTEAKAKTAQKEFAKNLQKEVEEKENLGKGVELDMVLIPAGRFMVVKAGKKNEITLPKPFYIGKYEVTQEQWEAVMGNNPSESKGEKLPVTNVSWNDCQEFIKKLNASTTNGGYKLPSEGEWEFACRAGTTTTYSFGDSITKIDANYGDGSGGRTKPVGSYKPNSFGLYDMHGNVFERCEDILFGEVRVIRGGCFFTNAGNAPSSYRVGNKPDVRGNNTGFRLARTP